MDKLIEKLSDQAKEITIKAAPGETYADAEYFIYLLYMIMPKATIKLEFNDKLYTIDRKDGGS
jgi:hypothetical protein